MGEPPASDDAACDRPVEATSRDACDACDARELAPPPRFEVTHDVRAILAAPIGRCLVTPGFVVWCHAPDLAGVVLWGTPDERALTDMMAACALVHHPRIVKRRRALIDCSAVEHIDADVLVGFSAQARGWVATWERDVARHAVMIPSGWGGIVMAGALTAAGASHPIRITEDRATAYAFLEHPAAAAAHAAASQIADAVRGGSGLVHRLRVHVARELATATAASAAQALGMSTRKLQRALARIGTSFSDELRRVRIMQAETLLVHSELKIEAISTRVGFGTASRLSAALRRERHVTASELRARGRG
ncbi:MAG: helix-turn-helix transcriptional regulator [Deltaproteobacteria bacterium]|nr:helix-turn-helix transcriptional regulator [Deltaproteobacteria bacterium]